MGCVSDKDRSKLYMLPTKELAADPQPENYGAYLQLKTNGIDKTSRTDYQESRTNDKGAATPAKFRETTTVASFTPPEKLLRPVTAWKGVVLVPKGEEDRLRHSRLGGSRLRSTGKGEWQIDKGDSKIRLSAIKSALINQKDPFMASQPELQGKIRKEFSLNTELGPKQPIKESIYFDESIGAAEKMHEIADPKLVNFHAEAIMKEEILMVKTYLYNRELKGRIME